MKQLFELLENCRSRYGFDKAKFLLSIGEMNANDLSDWLKEIDALRYVSSSDADPLIIFRRSTICALLDDFWQEKSDNCPVEASVAETQIDNFEVFVCNRVNKLSPEIY